MSRTESSLRQRLWLAALLLLPALLPPAAANDERDSSEARESRDRGELRRERSRSDEDRTRRSRDSERQRDPPVSEPTRSGDATATSTGTGSDGDGKTLKAASSSREDQAKAAEDVAKAEADAREEAAKAAEDYAEDQARAAEDAAKDAEDAAEDAEEERQERAENSDRLGEPYRLERDSEGRERVPGEVLMIGRADAVARVRAAGYQLRAERRLAARDESVLRVVVPAGLSVEQAVRQLQDLVPAASVAPNHVYRPSQAAAAARPLGAEPARGGSASLQRTIGILDTGVDTRSGLLASAVLRSQSFTGSPYTPRAHGTLVAELAAARGAWLAVADVFGADGEQRLVAPADAIAAAIAWLMAEQVPVINISIEGPDNAVMALMVQRATQAGIAVVAAAGNGGPAAAPVYPAAYADVIAVTAIDAQDRVYRRANRGAYISFAAPGVDVVSNAGSYDRRPVSGTSFAAPRAAAVIAERLFAGAGDGGPLPSKVVLAELRHRARDLGAAGRDPVFGWGAIMPAVTGRAAGGAGAGATRILP